MKYNLYRYKATRKGVGNIGRGLIIASSRKEAMSKAILSVDVIAGDEIIVGVKRILKDVSAYQSIDLRQGLATHRHRARGSEYHVITQECSLQTLDPVEEGTPMTLYYDVLHPDKYWVRPTAEFNDGRFAPINQTNSESAT